MTIVVLQGLEAAAKCPQCIACCSKFCIVGCAGSFLNHFVEKAGPIDPKILPLLKSEKNFFKC